MNKILDEVIGKNLLFAGWTERKALVLGFEGLKTLQLQPVPNVDGITVEKAEASEHELAEDIQIQPLVGSPLYAWWQIVNNAGITDGVMLAFSPNSGIVFSVMASSIQLLSVAGDQFA